MNLFEEFKNQTEAYDSGYQQAVADLKAQTDWLAVVDDYEENDYESASKERLLELEGRIDDLETENADLSAQLRAIKRKEMSLQMLERDSLREEVSFLRAKIARLEGNPQASQLDSAFAA